MQTGAAVVLTAINSKALWHHRVVVTTLTTPSICSLLPPLTIIFYYYMLTAIIAEQCLKQLLRCSFLFKSLNYRSSTAVCFNSIHFRTLHEIYSNGIVSLEIEKYYSRSWIEYLTICLPNYHLQWVKLIPRPCIQMNCGRDRMESELSMQRTNSMGWWNHLRLIK